MKYIERAIGAKLLQAIRNYKSVLITGSRQVGKSTLLKKLLPDYKYISLDDPFLEQQAKDPITWITISHQLVHIRKICDMVHFMEKGNIIAKATPREMFENPAHPSVIRYLANTEVSFKG